MIRIFNQYFPVRKIIFFAGECAFVSVAVLLSLFYHNKVDFYLQQPSMLLIKTSIIVGVYQVSLFFSDFYSTGSSWNYRKVTLRLIISIFIASLIVPVIYALTPLAIFDTTILITTAFFALLFLLPWRILHNWFISLNKFKKRVLVLGSGELAKNIVREILKEDDLAMHVLGFISNDPKLRGVSLVNPKVIGDMNDLPEIVKQEKVDKVIVAMEER